MKRSLIIRPLATLLFPALILLPLALGCHSDTRAARIKRGEVSINIGAEPTSLDPGLITDLQGARALMQMMRGLTVLAADGTPRPELAESWTVSEDGLVYTFKLREAYWSNGDRITANDFVYEWRRVLEPTFASQYAYQLFYIKNARAYYSNPAPGVDGSGAPPSPQPHQPNLPMNPPSNGPATSTTQNLSVPFMNQSRRTTRVEDVGVKAVTPEVLEVTLEHPTPFFLQIVAHQTYFPVCAAAVKKDPSSFKSAGHFVCSGPFKMLEYQPNYKIVVEKNERYWNAKNVKMNRVIFRMIELESTELIAYDNGEIDGTQSVPIQDMNKVRGRPDFHQSNETATYFINLNTQRAPLDNVKVRRALAMAIDRKTLVEKILNQNQRVALSLTPPEIYDGKPPADTFKDKDYDGARALLADAGYTPQKPPVAMGYLYNTMEGHRLIAENLQETWRKELGIDLKLENQDWKVQVARRHDGDYDISRAGWHADFPDPINFLEIYDSKSENNDPKFHDQKYDAMLAAIHAEANPARRMQLMREAEEYLMRQMPIIPLYFYTQNYLSAPGLKGYDLNLLGLFDAVDLEWTTP